MPWSRAQPYFPPVLSRYPGERGPRFTFFGPVRSHHLSLLTFRSWESCKAAAPSSSGQVGLTCAALGPFIGRTTQGLDFKRTIVHTDPSHELLWALSITRSAFDKGHILVICMTHYEKELTSACLCLSWLWGNLCPLTREGIKRSFRIPLMSTSPVLLLYILWCNKS